MVVETAPQDDIFSVLKSVHYSFKDLNNEALSEVGFEDYKHICSSESRQDSRIDIFVLREGNQHAGSLMRMCVVYNYAMIFELPARNSTKDLSPPPDRTLEC